MRYRPKECGRRIHFTVNQSKPKKLILSFEHVGFMDSAGIGLIIGRYKLMGKFGRRTGGFTLVSQNGTNCISVGCREIGENRKGGNK